MLEQRWESTGPVWQNPIQPLDVTGDGFISSIDALYVQSYINSPGAGPVPANAQPIAPFYDVNGDDSVTSYDYLLLVNYLNSPTPANLVPAEPKLLRKLNYTYTDGTGGLPAGLVTQMTETTGRASGNSVTTYEYYNTPTDASKHAKPHYVTEGFGTSAAATTTFDYDVRGNLSTVTDPAGRQSKFYYDKLDRLIGQISSDPDGSGLLLPNVTRYEYDQFNNLIATELVSNKLEGTQLLTTALVSNFIYDASNRVVEQYEQRSTVSWYVYLDGSGNVQRTTNRATAVGASVMTSGKLDDLAKDSSPIPNLPSANLSTAGLKTSYTYFTTPNTITQTQIDLAASNPAATSRTWTSVLDRLDRVVTSLSPDPVTGLTTTASDQRVNGGFVTSTAYDNLSNVLKVTNGLNQVTSFTYDDLNRITKVSTPSATSGPTVDTQFAYSTYGYGWKITQTDALGGVVDTQLDGLERMRAVSGSATSTQNARYWTDGALKSTTDQRGNVTDYDYDVRGRLKSVTEPAPTAGASRSVTNYQYSVDSLLSSVTDPMSRVTSFSYDAGGRNTRVTQPDPDGAGGQTASYSDIIFDSLGNVQAQQDALGHKTTYTLDSRFQTIASTDALGATTNMNYDSFGNVLSVLDPLNNSTVYAYNNWNQVVTENKPVSGTNYLKKFSYDGLGNLRTETDRRGRIVDYAYDNRNRVTTETWKTTSTVSRTFNYSYDNLDRTTAIDDSDPFSTDFQFVYDAKSQLQSERQSPALVGTSVAFDRNYDADGNETQLIGYFGAALSGQSFTGGIKDFINNYAYDGMNRVTSVTQATPSQGSALGVNTVAAKSAYFTYNAASQLTDMRRYNSFSPVTANLQVHSRYAYDNAGRLTSITHGRTLIASGESWNGTSTVPASLTPSSLLAAYSYRYDTANRITSMSSYRDAFKAAYTYDDTNQLTAVANTAISGLTPPFALPQSEDYQFDANGNRKSTSGASQSATGTQNRLQTDGTYNYSYDAEGNTTQRTLIATGAVTDYGYTYKNWLASVTERASAGGAMTKRTEFVYDAFGQRVGKRVDSDGNGTWDRHEAYVWADGQEVLRLVDSDGDGTAQPFRVANRYLYAGMVDQLIADEQFTGNSGPAVNATSGHATAGNTLYPLTDHLGSVRDLIDNNGINRQHVVYDNFGRRTLEVDYNASGVQIASNDPAAIDELFGYTGRDWDTDVGLQYNRARWYNPNTGRWMNQDPIGFAAGDANLYRYVGNEATGATDPSGLEAVGHHLVPEALWAAFGFDMTVADDVFNRKDARIETDVMYESGNTHNHTAHGKRVGYTAYVTDEMNTELCKFMTPTESKKGMSIARQREFAEHFLDHIKKMPTTTFIGAFNEEVATRGRVGQRAMKLRHSRGHFPKATGSDPIINVATGATVHLPPRRLSIGGRIVTAAPIVGFTLLFTQLRAQGKSVVEAGSRAVLDEGTMGCTEIAVDLGQAIGNEYFSVADQALQTNKNLHKKQASITSGGEIPATMGGRTLENWDPVPEKMPWWLGIFYW